MQKVLTSVQEAKRKDICERVECSMLDSISWHQLVIFGNVSRRWREWFRSAWLFTIWWLTLNIRIVSILVNTFTKKRIPHIIHFLILRDEGQTYDTRLSQMISVVRNSELHSHLLFDEQQNDDGGNKVVDMERNRRSWGWKYLMLSFYKGQQHCRSYFVQIIRNPWSSKQEVQGNITVETN